ncbi:MAG TPA: MmgE/PrpD family protein [Nitrososphaerales archaeon]|nr:MmgE/PrpD family protein [Nitrososphaerales archaeon]
MALAEKLASYALSTKYSDLGGATVAQLKLRVVDALGCALGAYRERPVVIARRVAETESARGEATILGTETKTSEELATFVNGLMIRYFDFNDTYLSKEPAHPSDNLSACLAVAEKEGASGKEFLTAAATAYEIQCRLCDAADIRHRGWDHVNYGLVSTALAASKLMGLDAKRAAQAVNIALSGHIAMRQVRAGELSMWKGASFANAARNGVFAARLAAEGMTGPAPVFEGEMGFFKQVSGPFRLSPEGFGRKGRGFRVNDTYIKYWPAEYHAQTAIWAALEVRKRIKGPGDVETVLVETHEAGYNILGKDREKWHPTTKETADHSLPFMVGMALLKGTIENASYSEENIASKETLSFLRRVTVKEDPDLTALYPSKGMGSRVTLKLKDGRMVSAENLVPKGHPLNPMSRADVEAKFIRLCQRQLGARTSREALKALWQLDAVGSVRGVPGLLRVR